MIVLPKWQKELAEKQRQMRRNQRRVTSEEARAQAEHVMAAARAGKAERARSKSTSVGQGNEKQSADPVTPKP